MPEKNVNQNKPSLLTRILLGTLAIIALPITFLSLVFVYFFSPKVFKNIINFFMPDTFINNPIVTQKSGSSYASFKRPLKINSFHGDLIKCATKLGYPAEDEGVCRGFTMRWIEAVITDSKDEFLKRAEKITQLSKLLDEGNTIEGLIQEKKLSPEEHWDIKAFYESLLLYQYPHLSAEILGKPISQGDVEDIGAIASSDIMREQGGIKQTGPLYYGYFEKEDITSCLNALQEKVIESGYQKPVTFLLSLVTPKGEMHAVSMIFYPNDKTWQFMDVNSFPPKASSNIEELITILPISSYQSFSLRGILPSDDFTKLQEPLKISSVTQNLKHAIDLLHHASRQGDLGTVEMLLAMHVDPNSGRKGVENPLYIAAQKGHVEVVRALLAKGTNPNQAIDDGATPLFIAAQRGHVEVVRALLAHEGIEPNKQKSNGVTPLLIAAYDGNTKLVRALLDKGANPNLPMADGATPLFVAAEKGYLEVVQELLAHDRIEPNKQKSNGVTPLFIAAHDGNTKLVRALLDKGANPNLPMTDGATPLFVAAEKGYLEVVQELLAHDGIELNKAMNDGATPLFIAVQQGRPEIVKALLAHDGIEPNKAMNDGTTPLFIATESGHIGIVQELLAHDGIEPNKSMNDGATPLFIAAEKGCLEVVQELLAHVRIKPNQAMINGATPLFIAAQNGCFEVVEALLKHENIDVTIAFQSTSDSLEKFARNKIPKNDALIERMNQHIAQFKASYPEKQLIEITPQEIAAIMGHQAVLELLSNPEQSPQHGVGAFRP
jgi:ankyrin repeat protein